MHDLFQYLLKLSIALGVVFIFYRLVLRPLTFYQWNRRYLILYPVAAFFIPFINLYKYVPEAELQETKLVKFIPVIQLNAEVTATAPANTFNPLLPVVILLAVGSVILLIRLIIQWYSLRRIRKNAVQLYHPDVDVFHVDEHVIPFSFGKSIYLNTSLHNEAELHDIILHEFVHVKQKHSFDILLSEILCVLNWYNPFAWLIRHAIRQNLEFIADQAVLNNGLDRKTYQYHLLKVIGSSQYSIANNFNFSSLKKRIAMMNRIKSARLHLVKFLFVLPLLAVLLVAFRNNDGWYKNAGTDTIPERKNLLSGQLIPGDELFEVPVISLKEFYKRNPAVKEVSWSDNDEIILYKKNGKREVYLLNNKDEIRKFEAMYGSIPAVIPPPPAPPSPSAPTSPIEVTGVPIPTEPGEVEEEISEIPVITEVTTEQRLIHEVREEPITLVFQDDELQKFYKRNPDVNALMWRNKNVLIRKKDGSLETYSLTDKESMARFKEKYGDLPDPPKPPTPPTPHGKPVQPSTPHGKSVQSATIHEVPAPATAPHGKPVPPAAPKLPDGVKSLELDNNIMILRLKDGSTEKYNLTDPKDKAEAEKKYGNILKLTEVPRVEKPIHKTQPVKQIPQKDAPSEPVIYLNSSEGKPASVKVIENKKENVLYADQIVIHAIEKHWYVKEQPKANPVYYINGKKASADDVKKVSNSNRVSTTEIIHDRKLLDELGEKNYNSLFNLVTKENVNNKNVYLSKKSVRTIEEAEEERILRNTLYLGIENPLVIKVEGVPDDQIEVTMTGGRIIKRDGQYYAIAENLGNVQVHIYKKQGNERKLLNKRYFRVLEQPNL
ncbi:MAG TPA: M56 family metallopeptidase [Chitinophagaceae bacterium]